MSIKEKNKSLKIQNGDVVEFLAIDWQEGWDYDFPSAMVEPVFSFNTGGCSGDNVIANALIKIIYSEHNSLSNERLDDSFIRTIKKVVKERLAGKETWKSKRPRIYKQRVEFVLNEEGELEYNILSSEEK